MAVGFFMLNFIYIKFLIIWRTAAASSMLDLVLPIDNMNRCAPLARARACLLLATLQSWFCKVGPAGCERWDEGKAASLTVLRCGDVAARCVCNNYTFAGFWRSWHASLHVWILRCVCGELEGAREAGRGERGLKDSRCVDMIGPAWSSSVHPARPISLSSLLVLPLIVTVTLQPCTACRYMYVPLGGTGRRCIIAWPIFVFVGLWHDLEVGREGRNKAEDGEPSPRPRHESCGPARRRVAGLRKYLRLLQGGHMRGINSALSCLGPSAAASRTVP